MQDIHAWHVGVDYFPFIKVRTGDKSMLNVDADIAAPETSAENVYEHSWKKPARGGFIVIVEWRATEGGKAVWCQVHDQRGDAPEPFALNIVESESMSKTVVLTHSNSNGSSTFVDVTITLQRVGNLVTLVCNMPITESEYFNGAISEWHIGSSINTGIPGSEQVIEAPENATDLFPFVWLQPLTPSEVAESKLRFVSCEDYAEWPLYKKLASASDADTKRKDATDFQKTGDFVSSLTGTMAMMPEARQTMLNMHGDVPLETQTETMKTLLGFPEGQTLAEFLDSSEWTEFVPKAWQSVFSLTLVGTPSSAQLAGQLVDSLRIGQYAALLTKKCEALVVAAARLLSLNAFLAIPDVVAALPPSPKLSGGDEGDHADKWEVLGVGHLQMARQHLIGYAAGELADVVNVMARERQEKISHSIEKSSGHNNHVDEKTSASEDNRQNYGINELADTLTEVMGANGLVRNMTDIKPTYQNLNLSLSGSWAGSAGDVGWTGEGSTRAAQQLTEHAVRKLGDRIGSRRGKAWQEMCERRESQTIDNSAHDRLVGIYCWVDRLVRVRLVDEGNRLVLAFLINQPAQPWLNSVLHQGSLPIHKPAPLPEPTSGQPAYAVVTRSNYQTLGAQYGFFDMEPPPSETVTLSCTVNRVTLGDTTLIAIPDGYAATSGIAIVSVADSSYNVVCAVGGVNVPPASPSTPSQLTVNVPPCTTSSAGPAEVPSPTHASATLTTEPITLDNLTSNLPITVMTSAPLFAVTIEITCALIKASDVSPLFVNWQIRSYDKLVTAWRSATRRYDEAAEERIAEASAGRTGEVQRDTLQQACLTMLADVDRFASNDFRGLAPLFNWQHMTWQYQAWPIGESGKWPEFVPSGTTRPSSDVLFKRFLTAQTASVMLPVAAEWEAWVLYYLQFQQYWAGGPTSVPVTMSTVPLIEQILHTAAPNITSAGFPQPEWTVRIPTSMLYLQEGSNLPQSPVNILST